MEGERFTFEILVKAIRNVHENLSVQAAKAVNISLTLRNWLIGCYIHTYEQNGSDRATYGEQLLENLSLRLKETGLQRIEARELRRYRRFFIVYPQIRESLTPELKTAGLKLIERLSFTHLVELIKIEDPLKRVFYESECIRGNWYGKNEMTYGDNPPVGILLCTQKNHALVEYALAGMGGELIR